MATLPVDAHEARARQLMIHCFQMATKLKLNQTKQKLFRWWWFFFCFVRSTRKATIYIRFNWKHRKPRRWSTVCTPKNNYNIILLKTYKTICSSRRLTFWYVFFSLVCLFFVVFFCRSRQSYDTSVQTRSKYGNENGNDMRINISRVLIWPASRLSE